MGKLKCRCSITLIILISFFGSLYSNSEETFDIENYSNYDKHYTDSVYPPISVIHENEKQNIFGFDLSTCNINGEGAYTIEVDYIVSTEPLADDTAKWEDSINYYFKVLNYVDSNLVMDPIVVNNSDFQFIRINNSKNKCINLSTFKTKAYIMEKDKTFQVVILSGDIFIKDKLRTIITIHDIRLNNISINKT